MKNIDEPGAHPEQCSQLPVDEGNYRITSYNVCYTKLLREKRQKYFTQDGRWYIVKDRLRRQVEFRRHDVLTDPYPKADLILCRNVLIYFSRPEQERILGQFAVVLPPGGVLVLGKAETMLGPVREHFRAIRNNFV